MRKKVLVRAFVQGNLGDDLFVRILCERYPNTKFYLIGDSEYEQYFTYLENLKYIKGDMIIYKIFNYIYVKLPRNRNKENNRNIMLYNMLSRFFDENVYITGSFFIEPPNWKGIIDEKWYDSQPVILGCNFGPYVSQKYYEDYKKQFAKTKQISFRDERSLNMFADLSQAECHPDIIFNFKMPDLPQKDYYIVTVIDVSKDVNVSDNVNQGKYITKMTELVDSLAEKHEKVVLLSFCDAQGDKRVINAISEGVANRQRIEIMSYEQLGMKGIIEMLAGCKGIVATRFHAMILGFLFQKSTLPIVYNEKMENVLKDLDYEGVRFNIDEIDKINCKDVENNFGKIIKEQLTEIVNEAEKHFMVLDKLLT